VLVRVHETGAQTPGGAISIQIWVHSARLVRANVDNMKTSTMLKRRIGDKNLRAWTIGPP
jgi:hypothetical protein